MGKTDINARLVQFAWWTVATIVFTLVIAIRIRLLGIPLERDEGEYAYAGQLMLQGVPPYKLAYNMKFPGTYAAYALILSIFGQTIHAIHLGLLLVNAGTIALIFLLGRRLIDSTAGIAAATAYAVLSLSPSVLGLAAHATNFVLLPVLGGTLLLLDKQQALISRPLRLFVSGLLLGTGALMKQPALLLIPFGIFQIWWDDLRSRSSAKGTVLRILTFSSGAIIPLGITCLILWRAGVFDKFWFWTIDYAWEYGRLVPVSQVPRILFQNASEIVYTGWPLWTLAGIGTLAGICDKRLRTRTVSLIVLFFFSVLAVCPGFYFRPHYFILILPAVSLLAGIAMSKLFALGANRTIYVKLAALLPFALALSTPILVDRRILFAVSANQACGLIYPENPFVEAVRTATYLRDHTDADDTIAVLGSEPEIYFYSHRHSATGYIYMYGLMEPQKYAQQMQQEMINEIETARPKYLVLISMQYSWLRRVNSDQALFNWANKYTAENYNAVGLVNIKTTETDYFFGNVPASVEPLNNYILMFGRKL